MVGPAKCQHRHLWPGLATGDVGGSWKPKEILDQIQIARTQHGVSGHMHYHMRHADEESEGPFDRIGKIYAEPALIPASPCFMMCRRKNQPST